MRKLKRKVKKIITTIVMISTLSGASLFQAVPSNASYVSDTVSTIAGIKTETKTEIPSEAKEELKSTTEVEIISAEASNYDASKTKINYFDTSQVPKYDGSIYVAINNNKPFFTRNEITDESFEKYSKLDSLGRCGVCVASLSTETMPTGKRGNISSIKPTGWKQATYKGVVEGSYLYNRCHLIGWQLSAENKNKKNLITGTRYFNTEGMLPFENMVADYIHETDNHVMYRVTPVFKGKNLLATGVLIEALSVEDDGDGISFCVFVYNVQPGVKITYKDGSSKLEKTSKVAGSTNKKTSTEKKTTTKKKNTASKTTTAKNNTPTVKAENSSIVYISATGSKYHSKNNCGRMNPANATTMTRAQAEARGYEACKKCF